jgi:hypothetical protein
MHTTILFSTFFAASLASPLAHYLHAKRAENLTWTPAPDTTTTCDTSSDKMVSLEMNSKVETILNDACAAMMPVCAYQDRVPPNTVCIKTTLWPLEGPVNNTQSLDIVTPEGDKMSGDVQCKFP